MVEKLGERLGGEEGREEETGKRWGSRDEMRLQEITRKKTRWTPEKKEEKIFLGLMIIT